MTKISKILGFHSVVSASSKGQLGGLSLIWKEDVNLFVNSVADHFIDVRIGTRNDGIY